MKGRPRRLQESWRKRDELLAATGHLMALSQRLLSCTNPNLQDRFQGCVTSTARQLLPPAKFSMIKQTYTDSNRWIF